MVTIISSGKAQFDTRVSALTQFPTPLDCMRSTARSPPSQAPAARPIPSSSVASGTYDTCLTRCAASARWIASGQAGRARDRGLEVFGIIARSGLDPDYQRKEAVFHETLLPPGIYHQQARLALHRRERNRLRAAGRRSHEG